MPMAPEIVPKLLTPPVKVGPVILMAVPPARTLLALSMRTPALVAKIVPLSRIAPPMVEPMRSMPIAAVMVPELAMLPVKSDT